MDQIQLKRFWDNGHKFTPENTHITKQGWRSCKTCIKNWSRKFEQENRESRNEDHRINYHKRKLKEMT